VKVVDPHADEEDLWREYKIKLCKTEDIKDMDAIIFAVPHSEFNLIKLEDIKNMFSRKVLVNTVETMEVAATSMLDINECVLMDLKGLFNRKEAEAIGFSYWRL